MQTAHATTTTISLVVPAAGCGARAALNGNKILAPLCGRPLLWWTLHNLTRGLSIAAASAANGTAANGNIGPHDQATCDNEDTTALELIEVVVAVRPDERDIITRLWSGLDIALPLRLAAGGDTRQASVQAALGLCRGDLVAVHDAARPFADSRLLLRVCAAARRHGAAIAALPASDTVKLSSGASSDFIEATLPRAQVWLAQTPQVFGRELLLRAHAQAQDEGFVGTDCSSLVERLPAPALAPEGAAGPGAPSGVALVAGDPCNFKVTFAADLARAEALLAAAGAAAATPLAAPALPVAD